MATFWSDLRDWQRTRPGYWFRPKLYGYGAIPSTGQGWAVTGAFVATAAALSASRDPRLLASIAPLTVAFILLAHRKTDGEWRLRWGRD